MLMAETDVAEGAEPRLLPYIGKVEVAKKVHIYANGDKFFAGRNFVLNRRQLRSFDAFLNQVTSALKPNFGAVRTIRTPNQGHRVDDLAALESGKSYVASGQEKFVKLGYDQIATSVQKSGNAGQALSPRESVLKRKIQVSGRIKKIKLEPIAVYVYPNGESREPPKRLLVQPWIVRGDWQAVLALVNEKVKLSGAVRRLFELDSKQEVSSLKELKNEGSYVAAANEKFKDAQYGVSYNGLSPSLQQKRRYPQLAPLKKKSPHASSSDIATSAAASTVLTNNVHSDSSTSSSDAAKMGADASGRGSPEASASKPHPPVVPRKQHAANESSPPVVRNKGGIPVRPLKHKRELVKDKVIDLDKDEGGLYKAKNASSGEADTVDDTGAKTEVPVDEQKAEEVDEIQGAYRKYRSRKVSRAELAERKRRAAAATKIQSAFRGHRTRKKLAAERADDGSVHEEPQAVDRREEAPAAAEPPSTVDGGDASVASVGKETAKAAAESGASSSS